MERNMTNQHLKTLSWNRKLKLWSFPFILPFLIFHYYNWTQWTWRLSNGAKCGASERNPPHHKVEPSSSQGWTLLITRLNSDWQALIQKTKGSKTTTSLLSNHCLLLGCRSLLMIAHVVLARCSKQYHLHIRISARVIVGVRALGLVGVLCQLIYPNKLRLIRIS